MRSGLCPSVAAVLCLATLPSADSRADPCTAGGAGDYENPTGGAPTPAAATAVRMLSELVEFVEAADGRSWSVRAHYVFENDRDRAVPVRMVFPWKPADRNCTFWHLVRGGSAHAGMRLPPALVEVEPGRISLQRQELENNGFAARVDGAPVEVRFERRVRCAGGKEEYPFGHTFLVEFPPRTTRTLDIEYTQFAGPSMYDEDWGGCPCHGTTFLLETGALWRGTIGEITMRWVLAVPTTRITIADDLPFSDAVADACTIGRLAPGEVTAAGIPFRVDLDCRDNVTTVVLTARDVEPTGSVALAVHGADLRRELLAMQGCRFDPAARRPASDCCAHAARPLVLFEQDGVMFRADGSEYGLLSIDECFVEPPTILSPPEQNDAPENAAAVPPDAAEGEPAAADAATGPDAGADADGLADARPTDAEARKDDGRPASGGSSEADAERTGTAESGAEADDGGAVRADTAATPAPRARSGCGCSAAGAARGGPLAALAVSLLAAALRRKRSPAKPCLAAPVQQVPRTRKPERSRPGGRTRAGSAGGGAAGGSTSRTAQAVATSRASA